jgi:hypothetical protein
MALLCLYLLAFFLHPQNTSPGAPPAAAEAAMQLDQEEADWELEKQQQAAGGFK